MFTKIKGIKGVKSLSKVEQKAISGGFWGGCEFGICGDDNDCQCGVCDFFTQTPFPVGTCLF